MLAWVMVGILFFISVSLFLKILLMHRAADEIRAGLTEKIEIKTNTLLDISSHDQHIMKLAENINRQLAVFRDRRRRFEQGDLELKEAITNISHDLRTPLTAICGYLDLLEQEEKSEAAEHYLGIIYNRVEMMKQLTEELFRYSIMLSDKEEKPECFIINALLEESLAAYYSTFVQRGITPEISMPKHPVQGFADPSDIRRIFENIISNALKYSDGDFSVVMQQDGQIIFSNLAGGLNAVTAGRLFDRFFTVETGRNSCGLGLAVAKLLTERAKGSITAEYQDGRLYIKWSIPLFNSQ